MNDVKIADQELVRKVNKSVILNTLRLYAPLSRAELAIKTGLNRSTVSNIVSSLIDEGLVHETEQQDATKVGRPGISLMLRPEGGAVIGIEIGVDFISIILTDFVAKILWREWVDLDPALPQDLILWRTEELIEQALEIAEKRGLQPLGIGLGVPGLVDTVQGELIFAPNLKWSHVPFYQMWGRQFNLPFYTENEANAAALGEYYYGVARGVDNFIYLSSGVGLGGGVILGGKLYRGKNGFASEIGHMKMDPQGEQCACGKHGCWETQVGPRAVVKRVERALARDPHNLIHTLTLKDTSKISFQTVVDAARAGDSLCREALDVVGVNLGTGIANLVNVFNPELVVIGGALSLGLDMMMPVIKRTVFAEALPPAERDLQIASSAHGADACVFGAVAIVLDGIMREMAVV